jgi:hypothetical protein
LDIRRAFFQSLLCGAKAGFTYGAHGLWGWHKENAKIGAILFSGTPYYWRTALGFEGAWDTALCVHITNNYGLQDLNPMADTHENVEPWFLAADDRMDHFALYLPVAVPATLPFNAADYECDLYMLDSRRIGKPKFCAAEQGSILIMPEIEGDALILGKRRA